MHGKSVFRTVVMAVAIAMCMAACSGGKPAEAPDTTPTEKVFTIGMSQCNRGEPWRVQMDSDIDEAAKEHANLRVIFKDAQNQTTVQQNHVQEFISQGVDLIIVSPLEAAPLTGPVADAYERGIPVIVLDRAVLGDKFTMFIGADNVRIGEAAGRWTAEKLGGTGKIVELKGLMTSTPGQDRHTGFRKGIEGGAIEVVFEADMRWLQPNAQSEMESALTRFPEIDLVYAHNDPGAYGAYLAAKAAGREQDIVFVGIDGLPHEGMIYVEQGILDVSFEYPTGGKEAIEYALKILAGEETPRSLTLSSRYFTKDNIANGGEWLE